MVRRILIIILSLFALITGSYNVFAEEAYIPEEYVPEEYEELLENLPEDIANLLPDGIFSNNAEEVAEAAREMSGWEYLLDIILNVLGLNLREAIRAVAILCSILVLSSLIGAIKSTMKNEATYMVLQLLSSAVLVIALIELTKTPLERIMRLLADMQTFVNASSPLVCAMYAMGGNVNAALVNNYGLIVFLSVFENICTVALEMILSVCVSLTLASAFVTDGNLTSLCSAIKKGFTFFVGLLMLLFTTVISTQNLLASKADTVSSKAARMLAGQIIPVVGSTVGESLRTVGASIEYLRSSVGLTMVIVLILMVLPTLVSISLYRLGLIAANSIAGILDCGREGRVISELASIYGYAIAILSVCSIALLFLLTAFAKSSSPLS